jgi:hypothetical protein
VQKRQRKRIGGSRSEATVSKADDKIYVVGVGKKVVVRVHLKLKVLLRIDWGQHSQPTEACGIRFWSAEVRVTIQIRHIVRMHGENIDRLRCVELVLNLIAHVRENLR